MPTVTKRPGAGFLDHSILKEISVVIAAKQRGSASPLGSKDGREKVKMSREAEGQLLEWPGK